MYKFLRGITNITKINNKSLKDYKSKEGRTYLQLAAKYKKNSNVKFLLNKTNIFSNINYTNSKGMTALMLAAKYGSTNIVKMLLDKGSNPDLKNSEGITALMMASKKGHIDVIKLLIDKGADINITSNSESYFKEGKAINFAKRNHHWNIAELFKDRNKYENSIIKSILSISVDSNIKESQKLGELEEILKIFPSIIYKRDLDGNTVLIIASELGRLNIVKFLIDNKANINEQNNNKETALMLASRKGHIDIVKLLIRKGAI